MRTLLPGSIGLMGMMLLAGCAGQRYVNTMLYGPDMKPHEHNDTMDVPVPAESLNNTVAMGGTPLRVQASFQNDNPGTTVTSVQPVPTGYGQTLYKVTYLDGGRPNTVMYKGNGIPLGESREVVEVGPHSPAMRPTTAPSGSAF